MIINEINNNEEKKKNEEMKMKIMKIIMCNESK